MMVVLCSQVTLILDTQFVPILCYLFFVCHNYTSHIKEVVQMSLKLQLVVSRQYLLVVEEGEEVLCMMLDLLTDPRKN